MALPPSPLVAVDTNVLMDLGAGCETVIDSIETLRARLRSPRLVIPPTAQHELIVIARDADTKAERARGLAGVQAAREWQIIPINLMPVEHGIVELIGEQLRGRGLLPQEEMNDSFMLAETALLAGRLLLSSDGHLRSIDQPQLQLLLQEYDLTAPLVATPAEVVRKFFRSKP